MPQTRADGEFDESEILSPGWIIPLWDSVSVYYGEHLFQAGVVFEARYGYRLLRWGDTGQPELFPMPSRLIVLKDPDTDETASYLRFLIPEANDVASDAGTGFSGLVLYTMLSGCPVSVGKFSDGVLSGSASLWMIPGPEKRSSTKWLDSCRVYMSHGFGRGLLHGRSYHPWRLWEKG